MLFQLRTDNHVTNSEELSAHVQSEVETALSPRFSSRVRRVEVFLQDLHTQKKGTHLRCSIEVHLDGLPPVIVHDDAANLNQAVLDAVEKLVHVLDHAIGKKREHNDRVSLSGEIN